MGVDASFQAIPENCKLFIAARRTLGIAMMLQFFNTYALEEMTDDLLDDGEAFDWSELVFHSEAKKLANARLGLIDRYYDAGSTFDVIVYLLSPARRANDKGNDTSLIHQAIYGTERLHQDHPIGLVPAAHVPNIAAYLVSITHDMLHEHLNPMQMHKARVYKVYSDDNAHLFHIWDWFVGIRDVYQAAADHDEAIIITVD